MREAAVFRGVLRVRGATQPRCVQVLPRHCSCAPPCRATSSRALLQRAVCVAVEGSRRSAILGLLRDNCEHLQHMATPCAVWH